VNLLVCQLPDDLSPGSLAWDRFARRVERTRPDLTVLNEMPFGTWTARAAEFDDYLAAASIEVHDAALPALQALPGAVIGSRPVRCRDRLANEAYLLADGEYRAFHHKQYFPQEPGFFENTWFTAGRAGYEPIEYRGVRFGALLCTELMFNEWARHYRRWGVQVIVVPRASGTTLGYWHAAARMAAIVSGCYVLSSNRVSQRQNGQPRFGGAGFAYSPRGELLQETTDDQPCLCVRIDLDLVKDAQRSYPCNVAELSAASS
jgi:N-carbamoylputrescine amidase